MAKTYGQYGYLQLIFAAIILLMLNTGCAQQRAWSYAVGPESMSQPIVNSSVAVPPFSDRRVNENSNYWAMYLVPLCPYGWMTYNTPEGAQMHMNSGVWLWRPNEDIAKATAEQLDASHLFKEAFFTFREADAQLVLQGEILSTAYNGKMLSYGVSFLAPYLWLVGFPGAHVTNELGLSFKLINNADDRVLWQKNYQKDISKLNWLYAIRADFEYPILLKEILLEAVKDIRADLPKIQSELTRSGS